MVGNIKNYTQIDILRVFLRIKEKPTSRSALLKKTALGEGTLRSILDYLKKKKYILSNRQGHALSKTGKGKKEKIQKQFSPPTTVSLPFYHAYQQVGTTIKKPKKNLKPYQLRDIAVKNGAEGALIFRYQHNQLALPDADTNVDAQSFGKNNNFSEGDLFVVAFAPETRWAENGALAVAASLTTFTI